MHRTAWTSGCGGSPPPFPCPPPIPFSLPSPCRALPARGGPRRPPLPCPWALSLPPAPGSGAPSPACPPARASCPSVCLLHPGLSHHRWRRCSSLVLARALCRALCPSFRCPYPCLPRASALPCCCLHWRPARAPAPSCRCKHPGPSLVSVPLRCYPHLRPPLVPARLFRVSLPSSLGRLPRLAPRHPGWPGPARSPSPPSLTTHRCSCGNLMPIGVPLGVGGQTGCGLPSGKATYGRYGFGGLTWVLLGLVWARNLAPSLPSAAALTLPGEAPGAPVGPFPPSAACQGPWRGWPERRPRPLMHPGPLPGAGRQEQHPGRRGRPPRPAPGPELAV